MTISTWGFKLLDPQKSYRRWGEAVSPIVAGRQAYIWQARDSILGGVLIYTDNLFLLEIDRAEILDGLQTGSLLVARESEWQTNSGGLNDERRARFDALVKTPIGESVLILMQKKEESIVAKQAE
jgi:hypothetical protein